MKTSKRVFPFEVSSRELLADCFLPKMNESDNEEFDVYNPHASNNNPEDEDVRDSQNDSKEHANQKLYQSSHALIKYKIDSKDMGCNYWLRLNI